MIFFETLNSTNLYAKEHFGEIPEGEIVAAGEQTLGRGRNGRTWTSPRGNIYVSCILKNVRKPLLGISAGSLSTLSLIRELCPEGEFYIKWPNDVFCEGAKVAGILSECICDSKGEATGLVVGIGINLNMPEELLAQISQPAVSVLTCSGHCHDVKDTLMRFESLFHGEIKRLHDDPTSVFERWKQENRLLGKKVEFDTASGDCLCGFFRDIASDGAVLLETEDGKLHRLDCGDVRLRNRG